MLFNNRFFDKPIGPTVGFFIARMALPAAAVRLLVSFSAASLRSFFGAVSFRHLQTTALALTRFCITPLNASVRCFCNAFCANLLIRFGGVCGKRFGAFCFAVCFGFAFGGAGGFNFRVWFRFRRHFLGQNFCIWIGAP